MSERLSNHDTKKLPEELSLLVPAKEDHILGLSAEQKALIKRNVMAQIRADQANGLYESNRRPASSDTEPQDE